MNTTTQIANQNNSQVQSDFNLELDMDSRQMTVAFQLDHEHPKPAQRRERGFHSPRRLERKAGVRDTGGIRVRGSDGQPRGAHEYRIGWPGQNGLRRPDKSIRVGSG